MPVGERECWRSAQRGELRLMFLHGIRLPTRRHWKAPANCSACEALLAADAYEYALWSKACCTIGHIFPAVLHMVGELAACCSSWREGLTPPGTVCLPICCTPLMLVFVYEVSTLLRLFHTCCHLYLHSCHMGRSSRTTISTSCAPHCSGLITCTVPAGSTPSHHRDPPAKQSLGMSLLWTWGQ